MKTYGYARVSSASQNLDLQLDALTKAGCEHIFRDKVSTRLAKRPGLEELLTHLRDGDAVIVFKLDRLGRDLEHLKELIDHFKAHNIEFRSLTENFDTRQAGGYLIFTIMSALAQYERSLINERIREGQASARARGRFGGNIKKLNPSQAKKLNQMYQNKDISISMICDHFKISRQTLYNYLDKKPSEMAEG